MRSKDGTKGVDSARKVALVVNVCKERGGNEESDYAVKQDEKTGPSPIIDSLNEHKS